MSGVEAPSRKRSRALARYVPAKPRKAARLIAYDFETTRIKAGTPQPLYLTAYSRDPEFAFEGALHLERDPLHLQRILTTQFLTDETRGCKFVAWYGNGFDAYFIAAALITCKDYVLRPYLTRNNALRGLKVLRRADLDKPNAKGWEFLDGMAMLGVPGLSLAALTDKFAPLYRKLKESIDFEREEFDPDNAEHRRYAMRDSVGLYHAMVNAQAIMMDNFGEPLRVTMGGTCIRIFQAHIPEDVTIPTPRDEVLQVVRDYVMRGGYVYCARRYRGPVWKYDINQAYAAAMRDAKLPAGFTERHTGGKLPPRGRVYITRVTASKPGNRIPFYCRTDDAGRMRSVWALDTIPDTWLTSIEVEQLKREKWQVQVLDCWAFESHFNMREYIKKLERIRTTCEGGPSGPIGTMIKATGNHSFGKLAEQIEAMETLLAAECPGPEWFPMHEGDDPDPIPFTWARWVDDEQEKAYHQPQVSAFITAHVRMVVRRATLLDPEAWLYADTDCVMFSRSVTDRLPIDAKTYGFWKIEEEGAEYEVIAKKVYTETDAETPEAKRKRSAKGMNVKRLTQRDFDQWFEGEPPKQHQVQRQNFMVVMHGAEMYRDQLRTGTRVEATR